MYVNERFCAPEQERLEKNENICDATFSKWLYHSFAFELVYFSSLPNNTKIKCPIELAARYFLTYPFHVQIRVTLGIEVNQSFGMFLFADKSAIAVVHLNMNDRERFIMDW